MNSRHERGGVVAMILYGTSPHSPPPTSHPNPDSLSLVDAYVLWSIAMLSTPQPKG